MSAASLTSRVLSTKLITWRSLLFLQQDEFKDLPAEARDKLKASILANQFTQPFYVWEDPEGFIYCLDGKHRTLILEELASDGHTVPDQLPATFIHCENKTEAARLVLVYSSIYAKITQQGLFDFVSMYELSFDDLKGQVDLPEFSVERFEQNFIYNGLETDITEPEPTVEHSIVQPGDLFLINGHRVICGSFKDADTVAVLMDGKLGRILNCDPPYNLPADVFTNQSATQHADFAMAAGEMTDEEFVSFLELVMRRGQENTVPGAIHYIFMDWRHVWHMTEAGRRVYGSPQPKQLCVWTKDHMANGAFYRPQHELCFVFNSPEAKALWNRDLLDEGGCYKTNNELCFIFKNGEGAKHLSHLEMKDRIRTNVWEYPSANSAANPDRHILKDHPTPKPVAMVADSILDTTNAGDIVVDWFLGSGTCLLACEQTDRLCYGSELEPRYVHQILLRYIRHCRKQGIEVNFRHLNGPITIEALEHEQAVAV